VGAVAHDASDHRDGIELRLDWLVESDDLPVLLFHERVDRGLLLRRELELLRHFLSIPARPAHLTPVARVDEAIGSEAEGSTGQKSAEEEHQCVSLGAFHLDPQCDMT
jgi:hypothetical protein